MASLSIDAEELKPLISAVVREVLTQLDEARATVGGDAGRLTYGEAEAARLLGLQPHQLRDERRRGNIMASVGPGRKILYSRNDLTTYLASRRWSKMTAES